jgi:hypothetical protein
MKDAIRKYEKQGNKKTYRDDPDKFDKRNLENTGRESRRIGTTAKPGKCSEFWR